MKKLLLLLFSFMTITIFAQKEANVWYFGRNAGLDFSSGTPVVLTDGQLNTYEGCSTISDKNGKLLFYSDGRTVWNKKHQVMKYSNGGGLANDLKGNTTSTESGLIVPHPTKPDIYFLFTVGTYMHISNNKDKNPGFHYYTIDMSKNKGLGQVIGGPIDLAGSLAPDWSEKITAVKGDKCNTIWVLSVVNNVFKAYKVDSHGVDSTPISSPIDLLINKVGYLKVSPDGKKVAFANNSYYNGPGGNLVLFDFDTSTGKITGKGIVLTNFLADGNPYGVEFSKKSTKLYVSTGDDTNANTKSNVSQFDLKAPDIASTKTIIHNQRSGFIGALQLAPDGKIYVSIDRTKFLDVIENPDADSRDIIYKKDAVYLNGKHASLGLPPFIQSFFASANIVNIVDKATNKILSEKKQTFFTGDSHIIKPERTPIGATYIWTKDGKTIGTSSELPINDTDPALGSGIYKLKMIVSACKTLEGSVDINFASKPNKESKGPPLCVNNPIDNPQLISVDLNADTGITGDTYKWFLNGKPLIGENKAIYKATKKGVYKVLVTRNSQKEPISDKTFIVELSNKALITEANLIDDVDNSESNQLKIKVSGIGSYEYAIDNATNFSSGDDNLSHTFTKIEPGIHVIYIRDKNGCGTKIEEIAPIYFERFFTPNNDGYFDTWKVLGINNSYYIGVNIQIFDRYGKIIHIINQKDGSWDGTYEGKPALPEDYWFKAKLVDKNGNIKRETGHFSLIRN